ncbi:MAG: hypothetical protein KC587_19460, partial [Nitrospira sp.]|nr:hypothetical protein [Nitrospira sp.]
QDRFRQGDERRQGRVSVLPRHLAERYPPPAAPRGSKAGILLPPAGETEKAGTSSRRPFSLPCRQMPGHAAIVARAAAGRPSMALENPGDCPYAPVRRHDMCGCSSVG